MLSAAAVGKRYTQTITVKGGSGSYEWQLGGYDTNYTGLTIQGGFGGSTWTIDGTPTTAGGPFHISLNVWDAPKDTTTGQPRACNGTPTSVAYQFMVDATSTAALEPPVADLDAEFARIAKRIEVSSLPALTPVTPPPTAFKGLLAGRAYVPTPEVDPFRREVGAVETALLGHLQQASPAVHVEIEIVAKDVKQAWIDLLAPPGSPTAKRQETELAAIELDNAKGEAKLADAAEAGKPKPNLDAAVGGLGDAIVVEQEAEDDFSATPQNNGWKNKLGVSETLLEGVDAKVKNAVGAGEIPPRVETAVKPTLDYVRNGDREFIEKASGVKPKLFEILIEKKRSVLQQLLSAA